VESEVIIFDQERLSGFFDRVSRGFQTSPLEILLMAGALLVFVSLLIVAYQIQKRTAQRRHLAIASTRYEELAARHGLSPGQRDLVESLARFLHDPQKKYLLLVSQTTFNYCAARLHAHDASLDSGLTELRLRLGFKIRGPEQVPASSAELPEGQPVELVFGRPARRLQGRVVRQRPSSLEVSSAEDGPPPDPGQAVRVFVQNRSGLFSFESRVEQQDPRSPTLALAHSEDIRRIQRRRYYRRKVALPVAVRRAGTDAEAHSSLILDISGEGAALRNPEQRFAAGDDLQLDFQAGSEPFSLIGEVLRLSRGGRIAHVRFAPMREAARDRLIAAVGESPLADSAAKRPSER
jgi:hypothetical protein